MSTKIYRAWRCPADKMNWYLKWARSQMLRVVDERVEKLKAAVKPEALPEKPDWAEIGWESAAWFEFLTKKLMEAASKSTRDPLFDLECGLNLWIHDDGRLYIMPIGEHWIAESLDNPPEPVENYAYWNNTDRPDDVTEDEWHDREATWEEVCLRDHNRFRLYHAVVETKGHMECYNLKVALDRLRKEQP